MPVLTDAIHAASLDRITRPGAVDAVVVGSGATGGLSAQLLTGLGLKVLVLDAGRGNRRSWWNGLLARCRTPGMREAAMERRRRDRQPIQSQCYAWEQDPDAFVDDRDCPYTTASDRPFLWFRSRQLGGRLAVRGHGRQYYRLSERDLHPCDGLSAEWPIAPGELDPWYALVERQIGITGRTDNNPHIPNSSLVQEVDFTASERAHIEAISARWPDVAPMLSRFASPPRALDAAATSGRLYVRTGAVVRALNVDAAGRIAGVVWIDRQSGREERVVVPLVFLCASALESTRLLLMSRSSRRPHGIGASSGVLGRFVMDHIRVRMRGQGPPLVEEAEDAAARDGRCLYLPRFDLRTGEASSSRGFGVQVYVTPATNGRSAFSASAYGEMLPRWENCVRLDESRTDAWGIPVLHISCQHSEADRSRAADEIVGLRELADTLHVDVTSLDSAPAPPGGANHECGTARMGTDPSNSVVDSNNECWDARGLFITDGACLPSQGAQNPTLTYLALTARACYHAMGVRLDGGVGV